jgi:hypothetical protein
VITKILAFHEKELKNQASGNSKMQYLHVSLSGLRGRHHPCLSNIVTTEEVRKLRLHLKFLAGDYMTYQIKFDQTQKGSPLCKICRLENKTICHIITRCPYYDETRQRILNEIAEVCRHSRSNIDFPSIMAEKENLTQFILDPTSFNLQNRVHRSDPIVQSLFKLSRDMCFSINNARMKKLQQLSKDRMTEN